VLLTTLIARALSAQGKRVVLWTETPDVIQSRYVAEVRGWPPNTNGQRVINLDDVYERSPNEHIVSAYARAAGVRVVDFRADFEVRTLDAQTAARIVRPHSYVALDLSVTWPSRTWGDPETGRLVRMLRTRGLQVVGLGHHPRTVPELIRVARQSLGVVAALIKNARAFVGPDSLLAHVAQAVGTPAVVLFGSTESRFRVAPQAKVSAIRRTDLECLGCHHRGPAPRHFTECSLEPGRKNACMNIPAEVVFNAVARYL